MIKVGDYIKSDFASFIQGTVVSIGTIGKKMQAYKIKNPVGKIDYIMKGQADLLLTKEEQAEGIVNPWIRHD